MVSVGGSFVPGMLGIAAKALAGKFDKTGMGGMPGWGEGGALPSSRPEGGEPGMPGPMLNGGVGIVGGEMLGKMPEGNFGREGKAVEVDS